MKLIPAVALALLAAASPLASASAFSIDFEKNWAYGTDINGYYNGGMASDGTSGTNQGVSFLNVSGLSNDPNFTYYTGAPSTLGTAYAHTFDPADTAFINVAGGVSNALSLFYSSPSAITGAVRAYSGLNGTGLLLGVLNLAANIGSPDGIPNYDAFSRVTFQFSGIAESFDLTNSANIVLFDNISSVPEPGVLLLTLVGGGALSSLRLRRRQLDHRDGASNDAIAA